VDDNAQVVVKDATKACLGLPDELVDLPRLGERVGCPRLREVLGKWLLGTIDLVNDPATEEHGATVDVLEV
jgi:hypothetical protein